MTWSLRLTDDFRTSSTLFVVGYGNHLSCQILSDSTIVDPPLKTLKKISRYDTTLQV